MRPEDAPRAKPGESTGAYKVAEGTWREEHGLPRKKAPKTPATRRAEAAMNSGQAFHLFNLMFAGARHLLGA